MDNRSAKLLCFFKGSSDGVEHFTRVVGAFQTKCWYMFASKPLRGFVGERRWKTDGRTAFSEFSSR